MSKYIITGASGYIGSMLLNRILEEGHEADVIIRNLDGFPYKDHEKVNIFLADITNKNVISSISGQYDYMIHCAASTRSSYMVSNPVEVAVSIINGTEHILELARQCGVKSMVYLSSMEVYGQIECADGRQVTEEEQGYIDVKNVRNCYPVAKLAAESLCHSYHQEYGVPVKIARLAQTFGRGVRPEDKRVFAQFAEAVRKKSDIVLHTTGMSMGNYCDIDDAIDAILFILKNGENSEAYNVVNETNTMSIRDMAQLVAEKVAEGNIKVVYDIPEDNRFGYPPDTGLRLSGEKLRKLGWEAKRGLEEMYRMQLTTSP